MEWPYYRGNQAIILTFFYDSGEIVRNIYNTLYNSQIPKRILARYKRKTLSYSTFQRFVGTMFDGNSKQVFFLS